MEIVKLVIYSSEYEYSFFNHKEFVEIYNIDNNKGMGSKAAKIFHTIVPRAKLVI